MGEKKPCVEEKGGKDASGELAGMAKGRAESQAELPRGSVKKKERKARGG